MKKTEPDGTPPTPSAPIPGSAWHVEAWLDQYRTGELPQPDERRVTAHLEKCSECSRRLAELESFSAGVSRAFTAEHVLRGAAVSEPDWDRQRRAVVGRTVEPRIEAHRRPWIVRYVPQTALAMLALVVVGVLLRQGVRTPADAERRLRPTSRETAVTPPFAQPPEASLRSDAAEGDELGHSAGVREGGAEEKSEDFGAPDEALPGGGEQARRQDEPGRAKARDAAAKENRAAAAAEEDLEAQAEQQLADRNAQVEPADSDAVAGGMAVEPPPANAPAPRPEPATPTDMAERNGAPAQARDARPVTRRLSAPDVLQRLDFYAHKALASGDEGERSRALGFWRDSVAHRRDLDPRRKRAAAALVDSLARAGG